GAPDGGADRAGDGAADDRVPESVVRHLGALAERRRVVAFVRRQRLRDLAVAIPDERRLRLVAGAPEVRRALLAQAHDVGADGAGVVAEPAEHVGLIALDRESG